jgi:maleylpyruvate isomerase
MIWGMSTTEQQLAALRASTAGLLAGIDAEQWSDADMRAPSLLPNWTRGHVITHIARNADGITATLAGALRGEIVLRYPDGPAGRAADIEDGAVRSAVELVDDVRESAARIDRLFGAVADADGWDLPSDTRPVRAWVKARWKEVEIHRVDLAGAYTAADWPAEFVDYLLPRMADEVGSRLDTAVRVEVDPDSSTTTDLGGKVWTAGSGDPVVVRGPDWALLAWLIGRPMLAAGAVTATPELTPWL